MNIPSPRNGSTLTGIALIAVLAITVSARAQVPVPTFSKAFAPSTIGPGSVATLQFDITNPNTQPVTDLAFTDTLPAGVVIANPADAVTTCGGTLTAPAGGGTIAFSDGVVGATGNCSILVDVTSSTPGTHTNVSGDLTSSVGNRGPATADLVVATDRPGFTKSFSPSTVPIGSRSTLTLTADNTANATGVFYLNFADVLPVGMVIADPAVASTDCESAALPAVLIAIPGTSLISLNASGFSPSFPVLAAGAMCTVTVDVVGGAAGSLGNTTGELLVGDILNPVSCGKAAAVLDVTVDQISLTKLFTDDPVPAGATVTLEFTVTNFDRNNAATNISFTDDLDTTLSGLVATGLPVSGVCGAGSQLTGTSLLTLTGGNLAAGGSCTFSATLQVPAGAATGIYPNTTSSVTADIGGAPVVGSPATDLLFVSPAPALTKEFTDDPVGAGGSVTLEFSITNTSSTEAASAIGFEDVFYVWLPTASATPAPGFCGPGSTATFTPLFNPPGDDAIPARLTITGASLIAGESCTFDITLDVAPGAPSGTYPNVTTPVTATVGGESVVGEPAVDDLVVVAGPSLLKEFTDDPVQPGGTVTLEFTLTHDPNAPADATGISFTDDLAATLSGLVATGLPLSDLCGLGNGTLTGSAGDTFLTFSGGTLAPAEVCTFSVTLQVPGTAAVGSHTNTTSNVTATVNGVATTENPASDDLLIAALVLTKEFTDDPVLPGGPVTLQFTIENISLVSDATDIFFQDNLNSVLSGLVATGLPLVDVCGPGNGSLVGSAGDTLLTFSGGSLLVGELCSFSVVLQVPGGAVSGTYPNTTTLFSATINSATVMFPNAADNLVVSSDRLAFAKTFTDDPVPPGATATLEFTLTNLDASQASTSISFTDDLEATLAGLVATGLPISACGGTVSTPDGGSTIDLTGGSLAASGAAGDSCTFSVTVQVPGGAIAGVYTNTTSQATGTIGGLGVTGGPAIDDLVVSSFAFSKLFGGPVPAGSSTTLEFTITNVDPSSGVADISFSDDLEAVVPGMVAVGLPVADVCGTGSLLSGTSILNFAGGNLGPGGSCTFSVDVQVPAAVTPGTYLNTTSFLSQGGLPSAEPAEADIVVEPALAGVEIPVTTPIGTLVLITLLAATAIWRLRWRV